MVIVDETEVLGYTQVHDQVLHERAEYSVMSGHPEVTDELATDHGLLGNRSITDFGDGVGTHARLAERPRELTVGDPRDVLTTRLERSDD